jgi:hypothetical protein
VLPSCASWWCDHRTPAGALDPASPDQDRKGSVRVRSGLREPSLNSSRRPATGLYFSRALRPTPLLRPQTFFSSPASTGTPSPFPCTKPEAYNANTPGPEGYPPRPNHGPGTRRQRVRWAQS